MNINSEIKAIDLWGLSNLKQMYVNHYKIVYSGKSKIYGDIILKVNSNKEELLSEYNTLVAMAGKYCCKVYDYNNEYGLLLLENIIPGQRLREEQDALTRINEFIIVFKNIHKTDVTIFFDKSYLDWLRDASEFCLNFNINSSLTLDVKRAFNIGTKLFKKYKDRVLLHGDLHHDNILKNNFGEYSIIDPKGVIGPKIFDLPRFILNEMDYTSFDKCINHTMFVIETIGSNLDYSIIDITKLLYMEVILANVWNLEDNISINKEQIIIARELLNKINDTY